MAIEISEETIGSVVPLHKHVRRAQKPNRRHEGNIEVHKDGKQFRARVTVGYKADGTRLRRVGAWCEKRGLAEADLKVLLGETEAGVIKRADDTLATYLQKWIEGLKRRPATVRAYRVLVNKVAKLPLGIIRLDRVETTHLQDFIDDMEEAGYKTTSIRQAVAVLKVAFQDAVNGKPRLLAADPSAKLIAPELKKTKFETWTVEQIAAFLTACKDDLTFYPLFRLALATGMRIGELQALKWHNVNLEAGTIHVEETAYQHGGSVEYGPPKTDKGRRNVSIDGAEIEILRKHKKLTAALSSSGLVFVHHTNGTFVRREYAWMALREYAAKAGVPVIRFHDLRHTNATLLIGKGVNVKMVSERLGHASIAITLDIYTHVTPAQDRAAASVMSRMLSE